MSNELMSILEGLAHDRGISVDSLLNLVENSIATAIERTENHARVIVKINQKNGDVDAYSIFTVVEEVKDPSAEIAYIVASQEQPNIKIGDEYREKVPKKDLTRIAAQTTGQFIKQKLRIAEKVNVCKDFEDQHNRLITGIVREIERNGDIRIDFGRAEGVLPQKERIAGEIYDVGENITVLLSEINATGTGPSLIVSRANPNFIRRLVEREVAEVRDGTLEIKSIAREAGKRTKLAVHALNPKIDPIGACVGVRGGRIKMILKELGNEKVDIVQWSEDPKTYASNALQPAKLQTIEVDEENHQITATATEDQLSLAIGQKGQNAKLAVILTGWRIRINKFEGSTPSNNTPETTKTVDSFEQQKAHAVDKVATIPGIDHNTAKTLVENGFMSAEGIVETDSDYLASLKGIDTIERAEEIIAAARQTIEQ